MGLADRVRIREVRTLSDDWYVLKKTTFEFQRRDGSWQLQSRETYDRGDGATILLYSRARGAVVLVRQFRFPAYVNGWDDLLTEAPAGLLDKATPADAIRREIEEETGYRARNVQPVFQAYMSPGSVTERLHFFVAEYEPRDRVAEGGGDENEGEDIEVVELPIQEALRRIDSGEICDGKTIMLLQYAALSLFPGVRADAPRRSVRRRR